MGGVVIYDGVSRSVGDDLLTDMYRLRFKVFKQRLRWDIPCKDGLDCDEFDSLGPVYALHLDEHGGVEGCWRILPTTGPYMLKDVFPQLIEYESMPARGDVWEISRFAVSSLSPSYSCLASLHAITSRLLVALIEFGLANGIERFVAASDVRFERILKRSGLTVHRMGRVHRIGATPAVAGWINVTPDHLRQVHGRRPPVTDERRAA